MYTLTGRLIVRKKILIKEISAELGAGEIQLSLQNPPYHPGELTICKIFSVMFAFDIHNRLDMCDIKYWLIGINITLLHEHCLTLSPIGGGAHWALM